jgi:WD40 repeat protein
VATGKAVRTFDTETGVRDAVLTADGGHCLAYRFDPEGTDGVPGDDYLGLYNARTGALVRRVPAGEESHRAIYLFAPDGRRYAIGDYDGQVVVYDTRTGKELRRFQHAGPVWALAFSPDGRTLAASSGEAPIFLWDVGGR